MNNKATKVWYEVGTDTICLEFDTGNILRIPIMNLQGLGGSTIKEVSDVKITPGGYGLEWELLDVHLSIDRLVDGIYGNKKWMETLNNEKIVK